MMPNSRYRSILRSMLSAVLQSSMPPNDLRALAIELRRGRLPDELAFMIDRANEHFVERGSREVDERQLAEAENLVKKHKISRAALIGLLRSIDNDFEPQSKRETVIAILRNFFQDSSSSSSRKLLDILQATGDSDPFLKGIADRNR